MKKTMRWPICMVLAAFVVSVNSGTASAAATGDEAGLSGAPKPDPSSITGVAGDQTIQVRPRNDAGDCKNLQWAFDNAAPGGTVELGPGTFFLGDGKAFPRRTVIMRRGVRVVGKKEGGTWRTVIRGGGEVIAPTVKNAYVGQLSDMESGPIRVAIDNDDHPVIFEDIWFREWACAVVYIEACYGFEFRGCRISHPSNTEIEGAIKFVHAIWSCGARARGHFTVENNLVEFREYGNGKADDEQLLGIYYGNFDTVRVLDNVIIGYDEGIEIIGNRVDRTRETPELMATGPYTITVKGNRIDVIPSPGQRWPSTNAVWVSGNARTDSVLIEDNNIIVRGGTGAAFALSGQNMRITGNKIQLLEHEGAYPAGAVAIRGQLVDSVFENNVFEGSVRQVGISFRGGRRDAANSHGNRFDLGDSLAKLGAETTLLLGSSLRDNTFTGDLGTVVNNSPEGANDL